MMICYNNVIMRNEIVDSAEFLIEIRRGAKKFKREENYDDNIRRWANTKSLFAGLSMLMADNPNLANQQIEKFIRANPVTLKPLNDLIDTLPNAIEKLRTVNYETVIEHYYLARRQYLRNERKARKSVLEK